MWILPVDLSGLHVELTSGPHLLPPHCSEAEVDRLSWLLRATLKGVRSELRLDGATLGSLSKRKASAAGALVVVRLETSPPIEEITERVKRLGARCALLQLPEPQEMGYGWLEREVKAPLYRAIGAWLKRPEHPLSAFNVQALPVIEAAGLTTDPMELVDLVERCMAHRIRYADIGCDEADYRRSLLLTAGERLSERLGGLEIDAIQAALEVILWEAHGPEDRGRFGAGAAALVKVGLASYVAGDLRLGPLSRSIHERELLGALEAKMKSDAWTDESRRKLGEIMRAVDPGRIERTPASMGATVGTAHVPLPMEDLRRWMEEVFPGESAIDDALLLLRDLGSQPGFTLSLGMEIQGRLVQALRWLQTSSRSSVLRQHEASRLLSGLLHLVAARGTDAVEAQEGALREIQGALERSTPPWAEELRLVALFWNAGTRIRWPRNRDDLDAASSILLECVATWKEGARLTAAHLLLGEIAAYRDDYPRAREHHEAALRLALADDHRSNVAAAQLALARDALTESRFGETEQRAEDALAFYQESGELREAAVARILLGASLSNQQRREEAARLFEEALGTLQNVGDVAGQVECAVFLSGTLSGMGDWERAESLAREAVTTAEGAGLPISAALALSTHAALRLARGAIDEASDLFERGSKLYESVGVRPKAAKAMEGMLATPGKNPREWGFLGGLLRTFSPAMRPKA